MKMLKKLLTVLLTGALVLGLSMTAFAAEDYDYTVTFYAGNQGSFNGAGVTASGGTVSYSGSKIVVSGLKLGDVVGFNAPSGISLSDSGKYYAQGIRLSGRDNDEVAASVFTVSEDADYVVAYGIRGNMTSYTVNYQGKDGKALAPSQTFYGNIGDKPVVAYQYIEGYVPEALGLTKTLSGNEADNVFTFVYEEAPEEIIYEETIIETRPNNNNTTGTGTSDNANDDANDDANSNAQNSETETSGENVTNEGNVPESSDVIVDLDDEDVPMANVDLDKDQSADKMPLVAAGAIGGIGLLALIILIITFLKKRH